MVVPSFTPDPDIPVYFYDQVADYLAALIAARKLPPGARLPGERDLAVECGTSIWTVRRAVRVLADRGLVVTKPAKGTYVTRDPHDQHDPSEETDTTAPHGSGIQDLTDYEQTDKVDGSMRNG